MSIAQDNIFAPRHRLAHFEFRFYINCCVALPAGLMDIETVDIKLFANAVLRGGSPSEEVLKKFGERNGRISQLFKYLHAMEYYKGMHILKDYGELNIKSSLSFVHIVILYVMPSYL